MRRRQALPSRPAWMLRPSNQRGGFIVPNRVPAHITGVLGQLAKCQD